MDDSILGVGDQPDEVLICGDAKGQGQQLVLQCIGTQGTLQIIGRTILQAEPCGWISLEVGRARCVDALVTSSHVETHSVGTTLNILLQAFIYILAGFSIGHKAITTGTQAPMAAWCVHTLMLTRIPLLTLVYIKAGATHALRTISSGAGAMVTSSGVLTDLIISAQVCAILTLINVYACAIASFGHASRAEVNASVSTTCVFTLLI